MALTKLFNNIFSCLIVLSLKFKTGTNCIKENQIGITKWEISVMINDRT